LFFVFFWCVSWWTPGRVKLVHNIFEFTSNRFHKGHTLPRKHPSYAPTPDTFASHPAT